MKRLILLGAVMLVAQGCAGCEGWKMLSLKATGIYTNRSTATLPEGALTDALNVEIKQPNVVEPRHGFPAFTPTFPSGGTARAMTFYQSHLIAHTSAGKIAYLDSVDSPSAWTELPGTYNPPDSTTPVHFFEARQNLYFTTSAGLYKLDAYNGTPIAAGGVRALHSTGTLTGTTGFLDADAQVAYRTVWKRTDANGYDVVGPPSERLIVTGADNAVAISSIARATNVVTVHTASAHGYSVGNSVWLFSTDPGFLSGAYTVASVADSTHFTYAETAADATGSGTFTTTLATKNVSVKVTVPSGVTTAYHAEVYRTGNSASVSTDPGDEPAQVYDYVPTNVDISNGYFTFTDIAPDTLRGALLYTNGSQEGAAQANEPPPFCHDAFLYRDMAICLRTVSRQILELRLLATGSSGLATGTAIHIANNGHQGVYTADTAENAATGHFKVDTTAASTAQQIENTMRSLARVINGDSTGPVYAEYLAGPDDPPGLLGLVDRIAEDVTQSTTIHLVIYEGTAAVWVPSPPARFTLAATKLVRLANVVTATTANPHGLVAGQTVSVLPTGTPDANFAGGNKTIASVPTSTTFAYAESGSNATSAQEYLAEAITSYYDTGYPFDVSSAPAGIQISKPGQPEAMPTVNHVDIGSSAAGAYAGLALRDVAYVAKTDGVWRVSGTSPENLRVDLLDGTIHIFAPRTFVALNNRAYLWADQGVVEVSDSGARLVSWPISDKLDAIKAASSTNAAQYSFAVADEPGKRLILWTTDTTGAAAVSQAWVYNALTESWTRWDNLAPRCGVADAATGRLFFGSGSAATVTGEARTSSLLDYYDSAETFTVTDNGTAGGSFTISVNFGTISVGDAIKVGSSYATITSVADPGGPGAVLTTSPDIAAVHSGTGGTLYHGYQARVEWAGQQFGAPDALKQVHEAQVSLMDSRYTVGHLDFCSNLDTSWEGADAIGLQALDAASANGSTVRMWVPQPKAYSTELHPRWSVWGALARWKLQGLGLEYRAISSRTSR